jgi:hypothetical protein
VLRPDRVDLIRQRRGWKPAVDLKQSRPVPAEDEGPPWLNAVSVLRELLAGVEAGAGELTVVLSNHFVRYLLVSWDQNITSIAEFESYCRIAFEGVFGDTARTWSIRISAERPGAARLTSAIDADLKEALSQSSIGGLRLVSVQPYLMAAFNRLSKPFRRRDFCFVLAEPGRVCILAAVGGQWRTVRSHAINDEAEISPLVERELRLLETGEDPLPPLYFHAPGFGHLRLPLVNGMAPHALDLPALPGFSPVADLAYSMALAGA